MTAEAQSVAAAAAAAELRIFLVAGEHSGDALGGTLMASLAAKHAGAISFSGVGGELMEAQGLQSLFPMAEIAVMGPLAILKRLPWIIQRVYQTVDAAIKFDPDVLVVIDSPEFTHAVAKRLRRKRPQIPIVDYVSPTVWAWRPGRARAMRPYVDHLLALLPFEPETHARLGGPTCTYVGHPLTERLGHIRALDPQTLSTRLGIDPSQPILVVLPGSRRSEAARLIDVFAETAKQLVDAGHITHILVPVAPSVRPLVEDHVRSWPGQSHLIERDDDKWRAFKLARVALAASGTVTLELALAGTPMVVGYKVEPLVAPLLRQMIKAPAIALPNLVLGETIFPELIQEACEPERLVPRLIELIDQSPARQRQLKALANIPGYFQVSGEGPQSKAADVVLAHALRRVQDGSSSQ